MAPVAVESFHPAQSPLNAIANGLDIAEKVYGIKGAMQKADLVRQQLAQGQAKMDEVQRLQNPDSQETKNQQALGGALYNSLVKTTKMDPNNSDTQALHDALTSGTGYQIQNTIANNPMLKDMITSGGQQMHMDAFTAALNNKNQLAGRRLTDAENKQYKSEMGPFEGVIQSANRAQSILGELQKADPNDPNSMKSTKLLMTDLSGALGSMFSQGGHPTVHDKMGSTQDTYYGELTNKLSQITGQPFNTQTQANLNQMGVDVGALKNAYASAHADKYASFRDGIAPEAQEQLDKRYQIFRQRSGLDGSQSAQAPAPPSGQTVQAPQQPKGIWDSIVGAFSPSAQAGGAAPPAPHPLDAAALQWAKSNPNDPRSAKILQVNGPQ